MNKTLDLFLSMIFPDRCAFCSGRCVVPGKLLCGDCEDEIILLEKPLCPKCGREKSRCTCSWQTVFYKELRGAYRYESAVRRAIERWKFYGALECTEIFVRDMLGVYSEEIADGLFDYITFVPGSAQTQKERGFNQSELLARVFSAYSGIEWRSWLVRRFETPAQHSLPRQLRLGNVLGVFEVTDPGEVYGKTVLLIDDIKTTGTVLNECAKMLMIAGAEAVYCLAAAIA